MVEALFDPTKRDSAIGRISTMLDSYFDGDASRLAILLDPTRLGSPLHQFRVEVADGFKALEEKLLTLQASQQARAGERARSAAKGGSCIQQEACAHSTWPGRCSRSVSRVSSASVARS